ncbi:MAG: hypothetical protein ACI4SS_04475, partial [Clostridia bacterium]
VRSLYQQNEAHQKKYNVENNLHFLFLLNFYGKIVKNEAFIAKYHAQKRTQIYCNKSLVTYRPSGLKEPY